MARSIFIGDVHGCARELGELLERVAPVSGDGVYFVGDLVARGPDSAGVLRLFRDVHARGVVGNHEARLLEVRRARQAGEPTKRMGPTHEALLEHMPEEDWELLAGLPLYLEIPEHRLLIVHAGLAPGVALREQDPWVLTHIRSVKDGLPSDEPGVESWAAGYRGKPHVIFGHDARRRLQLHAGATGLDTACVYGEALTALVLASGETMPPSEERRELLVSVRAHGVYYTSSRSQ